MFLFNTCSTLDALTLTVYSLLLHSASGSSASVLRARPPARLGRLAAYSKYSDSPRFYGPYDHDHW